MGVRRSRKAGDVQRIDASGHQERLRARRDALVAEHLPLVRSIALSVQKSLPASFDLDDLIGTGHVALIEVAIRYRPCSHGGTPFSAYARQRIRGAMLDSVRRRHYQENTRPSIEDVPELAIVSGIEAEIDGKRRLSRLAEELAQLDPRLRAALEKRFWNWRHARSGDLEAALAKLRDRMRDAA